MLSYSHLAMGLRLRGRVEEAATLFQGIEDAFVASGVAFRDTYYTPEAGAIRLAQGRLHEAEELCRSFLHKGTHGLASERIYACALLGDVLREWNRLDESEACLREGIALAERFETPFFLPLLYGALALTLGTMGQTSAALAAIDAMTDAAIKLQNARQTRNAAAMRVRIALTAGQLEPVRRWMATRGSDAAHDPDRATIAELMVVARSLFAHGEATQALMLLGRISADAERDGRALDLVQSEVLRSLAYADIGDLDQALSALERALELAEPEGYLRVFLDEGSPMRQLLEVARQRGIEGERIERILTAADHEPDSVGHSAERRLHQPILENLE